MTVTIKKYVEPKTSFRAYQGDSLEVLKTLSDNSIDALITDPPYGLSKHSEKDIRACLSKWLNNEEYTHGTAGFCGHNWDSWVPSPMLWNEVFRVLKPGAYLAVFAGERTQDLMAIALRLAGFEYKHCCMYLYGSGFPKGQDIWKNGIKASVEEQLRNCGVSGDIQWK